MGAGKFGIGDASTPTITFDTVNDRLGVGSGITNPAYLIDAYSTNATTNIISIGGTTNYSLFQSFNNSGVFDLAIDNSAGSGFSQGAYSRVLHSTGAYPLVISTNSTERMRILSGGNVGIGTTTPDIFSRGYDRILGLNSSTGVAKIELNGSSSSGIDFGQAGSRVAEINGFTTGLEIGTVGSTPIYFTPNGTTRVAIASGGNVGIGETSPTQKLQVSGNIFASTGNDGGFILEGGNAILRQSGNQMGFNVSGSERMRITDGGNVGIGTTSPNTKLQVNSFYTYGTINDQLTLNGTVSGGTSSNPAYYGGITMTGEGYEWGAIRAIQTNPVSSWTSRLAFYTMNGSGGQPAVERMSIDNSGNVGIGTTNPGAKLAVNGTTLTGNVSSGAYVTPSQLHVGGDGTAQISLEDVGAATAAIALDGDKFAFGHQSSTPSYSFRYSNTYNGDYANTGTIFTSLNPTTSYINSTYVGIGTTTPGYKLDVNGNTNVNGTLTATVKSFIIDHPTKENKKLQYGVLEGPEHSVYVRGKLTNTNVIQLPDYWHALVHEDSITVNLTAIGKPQEIWVEEITDTYITVGSSNLNVSCFYTVFAERKDVDKLVTEFDKE
jgi:hypothetical protein